MVLKMRRPVSALLRESRMTSTRGCSTPSSFSASSFFASGKATPGSRNTSSFSIWYAE